MTVGELICDLKLYDEGLEVVMSGSYGDGWEIEEVRKSINKRTCECGNRIEDITIHIVTDL